MHNVGISDFKSGFMLRLAGVPVGVTVLNEYEAWKTNNNTELDEAPEC